MNESIFDRIHDICSEQSHCDSCPFAIYREAELHKYKCLFMTIIPVCWTDTDIEYVKKRLSQYKGGETE